MNQTGFAGNAGPEVRSDCRVTIEPAQSGGVQVHLHSKVAALYGESIITLCRDVLSALGLAHATVTIEDSGALPFVLAARIEAAAKQCLPTTAHYLPEMLPQNRYATARDRYRRSRLYLPGNTPKLMLNAGIHRPDGVILDLEDSVAPDRKAEARLLVRNALRQVDFYGAERMVRINQIPAGLDDLPDLIPHHVNVILIPKCEAAETVRLVDERIASLAAQHGLAQPVHLMPIIESALGVENAYRIATASVNVAALAIGLEDYTADLGVQRTPEGRETFFARSRVVNAARAAGIQAIDSVFSDVADMAALARVVQESKSLGFDGMGCIHPRQIRVIHENYAPAPAEIEKAQKIVDAFNQATAQGLGVVSLGSKMIDPPVVKRAQRIIELAASFIKKLKAES